jgi:hypothetical protein
LVRRASRIALASSQIRSSSSAVSGSIEVKFC